MPNFYKNRLLLSGSTATVLPVGDTADRPTYPLAGALRYNTDTSSIEYWNSMEWVSSGAAAVTYAIDNYVGDGTTTTFTLSQSVSSATQIIVFVGSIYQAPYLADGVTESAYAVSGNQITFSSPPPISAPINIILTVS